MCSGLILFGSIFLNTGITFLACFWYSFSESKAKSVNSTELRNRSAKCCLILFLANQRLSGRATSIPPINTISPRLSASSRSGVVKTNQHIAKSAKQIDFEQRRVMVDQTPTLIANIDNIIATEGGAIAAAWRQPNFDFREPHKERDLMVYAICGNWTLKKGFMWPLGRRVISMKPHSLAKTFFPVHLSYIYNVHSLPDEMKADKWRREFVDRRVTNFQGTRSGG